MGRLDNNDGYFAVKQVKELEIMYIDWSKAPEGAQYSYKGFWYRVVNEVLFTYKVNGASGGGTVPFYWKESRYVHQLTEKMTPRPQPTLTYTQAMVDNGELPSVGMECSVYEINQDDTHDKATIKYISSGTCVYEALNIEYSQYPCSLRFKPLTPPIELIDGECYQGIHKGNGKLYKGVYVKSTDEIFHCKCSNPASFYTNIQPLTVEVK